jgi:putative salt-induced outer membrane protein YdiY
MRQIPSILLLGAVAALTLVATVTRAATLVLANGDRLNGEVVSEHDGMIVFRSAVLGELSVPASQATVARDALASETAVTNVSTLPVAPHRPAPAYRDAADNAWKRQVELGLSAQEGLHEQSNVSVRLEAARTTTGGSASVLLSHHYGKSDGLLVTDTTSANALLTHNLSDDLFIRGATRYERDPVVGLDHAAEQSLGLGYTLLDRRALHFSVGAGAAVRHRDTGREPAGWDALVDAFGRVKCAFTERLSLSQDFTVSAAPDDRDDYQLKSHTALVNKLTDVLQMSVRYEFEYFGAGSSAITARQRFVTAIGCVF